MHAPGALKPGTLVVLWPLEEEDAAAVASQLLAGREVRRLVLLAQEALQQINLLAPALQRQRRLECLILVNEGSVAFAADVIRELLPRHVRTTVVTSHAAALERLQEA